MSGSVSYTHLHEMAVKDNVAVIVSLHEIELAAKIADYVMCVGADGKIEFGRRCV